MDLKNTIGLEMRAQPQTFFRLEQRYRQNDGEVAAEMAINDDRLKDSVYETFQPQSCPRRYVRGGRGA